MTQKDMDYVKYVVNRFLRNKPELEQFREDLMQEGHLGLLESWDTFDPAKGSDKELHSFMLIQRKLQRFVRVQAKHFRKEPVDHESPYWDLSEPVEVDEIEQEEVEPYAMDLQDIVDKLDLTGRQKEVLSVWLETGEIRETAERLEVDKAYVSRTISRVITLAKQLVNKS